MWTWGIDIATQHATAATSSSVCRAAGDMTAGRRVGPAPAVARPARAAGARRRRTSASGSMVTAQKTPMPRWVARHPAVSVKCCTIGGHRVPAR